MARLQNFVRKIFLRGFRAVLFRMVPKPESPLRKPPAGFRAVLFRMVPKQPYVLDYSVGCFRAVLFRMVPKQKSLKKSLV